MCQHACFVYSQENIVHYSLNWSAYPYFPVNLHTLNAIHHTRKFLELYKDQNLVVQVPSPNFESLKYGADIKRYHENLAHLSHRD